MQVRAVNQRAMSMYPDPNAAPVNPLPPVVWLLFAAIALPELAFQLAERGMIGGREGIAWRFQSIERYGFSGQAFDWMIRNQTAPLEHSMRVLTYPFVHQSFTSAAFSSVLLLALGKMVGEAMSQMAVMLLFFVSSVFGAVLFGFLTDQLWLYGAYTGVYGLIGGYTFLLWQRLAGTGLQQLQAFQLIGFLMGIQLVFGIFFATGLDWVSELAGFGFGFAVSVIIMPGGVARLMTALRRR